MKTSILPMTVVTGNGS